MTKKERLGPGDPVAFKIPVSCSEEQLKLINEWRKVKIISKKFIEKVNEELGLIKEQKLCLPISRDLTEEELERLANPEIQKMLGNLCLALLAQQVPAFAPSKPADLTEEGKQIEEVKTEMAKDDWEVPEEVDELIDDLLDDL